MSKIALSFANASCAHCARLVSNTLRREEGIRYVEVDQANEQVLVDFDPTVTSVDSIRTLMEDVGYPTQLVPRGVRTPVRRLVSTRVP